MMFLRWPLLVSLASLSLAGCTLPDCPDRLKCPRVDAGAGGEGGASSGGRSNGGTSNGGTSNGGVAATGGETGNGGNAGRSASAGTTGASGMNGASGDGGQSGAAGDGGNTACDPTLSPSAESCLVNDGYAIFVAPSGKDTAAGTKDAPVHTLAKAVALAGDAKLVIACSGTYDEPVKLTTAVKLYGGFACPGTTTPWAYELGKKAKVAPTARGLALSIASGTSKVVIEDFEFDAQEGVDPGESSVAALANASDNVALSRVKLVAGKGVAGAAGTIMPVIFPLQSVLAGHSASGDVGGAFNQVVCPVGGTTKGGKGGDGGLGVTSGSPGTPALSGGAAGALGAGCGASPSGTGGDGANALPQSPSPGATKLGAITPTGWNGASGTDGMPGTPGQGGGGGTGAATAGGGGGGGAGGCGGAGGTGGKAGGSSIALVVLNSSVTLSASELIASNAGKGGDGAAGQDGQAQFGAGGNKSGFGCGGGNGGAGGAGGAGGGAAGGISVGVAYQGIAAPTTDSETKTTTGTAGAKGLGGVPGMNDGIPGVKQDLLQIQ